jgi:hypothetical protein
MVHAYTEYLLDGEPNWARIANHLARKALRTRVPLPHREVFSLAGLAVAMSKDYYDPSLATCDMGVWLCGCGWRVLLTLIRDELRRRRREVPAITFTDLAGRATSQARRNMAGYELESALARRDATADMADWLESLRPEERGLARMRAGGWTLEEIADVCAQTTDWVRWRLKRMHRRLAQLS